MIIGKNLETIFSAVRDGINRLVYGKQFLSYAQYSLSGAASYLPSIPTGVTEAWIYVEVTWPGTPDVLTPFKTCIRYSLDNSSPVTGAIDSLNGVPMSIATNNPLILKGNDTIKSFRAVRADSTTFSTATLKILYFK